MAAKDFRVDLDGLRTALRDVRNLIDVVSAEDYEPGSFKRLGQADPGKVTTALGNLAGDGNATTAFVSSYTDEHAALTKTYKNLVDQLTYLETSIDNTIKSHDSGDENARGNVNNTKPGGEW